MSIGVPVAETVQAMKVAGLDDVLATGAFDDLDVETVSAILEEAGRFAAAELAPLNRIGDRVGARRQGGKVVTPPGWPQAYARWTAAGWNGVGAPVDWGGQGLPVLLQAALQEQWNAACAAFAVGTMLTSSAVDLLLAHADKELGRRFLPGLVSGDTMATMALTEPQAGSDLGAITTRAERAPDGTYRLFGQKIFITFGDHDFTDSIVHMVLARLTDAPAGTTGISLFLVPKYLGAGDQQTHNDLTVAGLEEKLGLHGAPTCTVVFGERGDGAVGWLVGEENRGLACMFTMMNPARLNVGLQGVGVAKRAYEDALAYARERRQGRVPGASPDMSSVIAEHPDVQRLLLRMKALTAAARVVCFSCAAAIDLSRTAPVAERERWASRAALLTPIAKAFATDAAIEVASLGIQVHGGSGYIEETGAAQYLRDARVFAIYEGTNGIQAVDLVTRKLGLGGGKTVRRVIDEIAAIAEEVARNNRAEFGHTAVRLADAVHELSRATDYLSTALAEDRRREALAGATPFLRLFGLALGGALLAKAALPGANREGDVALARFFAETLAVEAPAMAAVVIDGAAGLSYAAAEIIADKGEQ